MEVNLAENGNYDSPIELEFDDIECRRTDSDLEAHLANRRMADEYRGAEQASDFDVFKKSAKENLARKPNGRDGRAIQRFGKNLPTGEKGFRSSRKKRLRTSDRRNFAVTGQARIAEKEGAHLMGDYAQRMTFLFPDGEIACFDVGGYCPL